MPVLLVIGSGPGISHATAARFGREGYSVALFSRTRAHAEEGARRLAELGVTARGYGVDAADEGQLIRSIHRVREELGAISSVLFTAFGNSSVTDVTNTKPADVISPFQLGVMALLAVVQGTIDDLRSADRAAILAATGAIGDDEPEANRFATYAGLDGLALESAGKSKLLGLLSQRLDAEGIHVGEVVINGTIKGSPYATASAIDPARIAEEFWAMTQSRTTHRVHIGETA
jgi:NAD(P)-dependent dehydrogenase (short-subunit alcohol dehydrogenase family)